MRRVVMVLAAALLVVAAVQVTPAAAAAAWQSFPAGTNRTCSAGVQSFGAHHQVCLDFDATRDNVRAIAFINPESTISFSVSMRLWFGGGGSSISRSCSTISTSASRACVTAWTALVRPYVVAEGTFTVEGSGRTPQRALDMRLSAKTQLQGNWCGPAAAQTIIVTQGSVAPSQAVLAEQMDTGSLGTMPWNLDDGINRYVPQDWPYREISVPGKNDPANLRYRGLNLLVSSLARGRPVAALVIPKQLPWSPNASDPARHYIVLHGFGAKKTLNPDVAELLPWTPTNFKAWDPGAGVERNISLDELYAAAKNAYVPLGGIHIISS